MEPRPYQTAAARAVWEQWDAGVRATLMVMPTGTGKTIVFSSIIEEAIRRGGRCLILAHREELLQQAADKLARVTGLGCGVEKAESTAVDSWYNVVVGSVQTMQREHRRNGHEFTHLIVDEAHHAPAASYRAVLDYYADAKILGVTATADRGDKRNLGEVFETLAYEYSLPRAIRDGWLCRIQALTIPLKIELAGVKVQAGDFSAADVGSALDPYLEQIAGHVAEQCQARKTVCFLPLIATSQKFLAMLAERGMPCREVNGESRDRAETLKWFAAAGPGAVLCNAMLLTEGWDQPDVDCICVLRPTKVRSLYAQMCGRGTRIHPGKENLLLLDFLWHSERHELCRPAHLVCEDPAISRRVAELLAEESQATPVDILDAEPKAGMTATEEREEALRKLLEEQKHRKRKLVDPLQYEYSVGQAEYQPEDNDLRAMGPPTTAQLKRLEDAGIFPDEVTCQGHASKLLDTLAKRRTEGLTTPRQIRFLEARGFQAVGMWGFGAAKGMIDRIAGNMWQVPRGVVPRDYRPAPATVAGSEVPW
jgi:superfamily II DNA or RNA helicase